MSHKALIFRKKVRTNSTDKVGSIAENMSALVAALIFKSYGSCLERLP